MKNKRAEFIMLPMIVVVTAFLGLAVLGIMGILK